MTLSTRLVAVASTLVLAIALVPASHATAGDPWENERVSEPVGPDDSEGSALSTDSGTTSQLDDDGEPWENERLAGNILEQSFWLARAIR